MIQWWKSALVAELITWHWLLSKKKKKKRPWCRSINSGRIWKLQSQPHAILDGQQPYCPGCRMSAREWLTHWHQLLGCHQGLAMLLVMTGKAEHTWWLSSCTHKILSRGLWFTQPFISVVCDLQGLRRSGSSNTRPDLRYTWLIN